ncbi:ABC transporter substrate-binding protein [Thermomonospora umbrina]|uniref:ABC-type branched-subunit amino acid transport system substrate-binding protein n=1 Tax=Thermomonospora umbrina TaxID=111806 RepID=A0A3D9SQX9_9ACTN|nr:ABC transporter substrate-binding protein [Thermomonospora umbrina]REE96363.1 ABC-type branched-subunit amino acid transport system substrate-binding protein [Thermomonospora umbrina]
MASERVEQGAPPQGDARSRQLVGVLRQLRRRPTLRAGDRLRPLLLAADEQAWQSWAADRLVTDCRADGGLYARVHAERTGGDVAELLRDIAHQLSESGPRLEPPLRFQLLSMALWLQSLRAKRLRLPPSGRPPAHAPHEADDWELAARLREHHTDGSSRRVLAAGIRLRRQRVLPGRGGQRDTLASVLSYLEQVAPIGVAVVALVSATAASTLDVAAALTTALAGVLAIAGQAGITTWDWAGRRRYRWFAAQRYGRNLPPGAHRPGGGFLAFALDLVYRPAPLHGEPAPRHDDDLDKLLIAAFLEDLRQGYRRSWRRVTWARVRYPTVILDAYDESVTRRFITLVEQVRAERLETRPTGAAPSERERRERDRLRPERVSARLAFDPLVIVACPGPAEEVRRLAEAVRVHPVRADLADLGEVQEAYWDYWDDRRRAIALGYARDVPVDLAEGDGWSAPVLPRRNRPPLTHPVVPWLAAGVVLAASVGVVAFESVRYCDPHVVWHADNGECVGVTDGSYAFNGRLRQAEHRIRDLNRAVEASGKPYVTIVYIGALSTEPSVDQRQADLLAGVHGELVGLSIAQEHHYEANGRPLLKVLVANAGSRFRYATEVAERIRRMAVEDRTIVGVVGFGDSKRETGNAINLLSQAALPMVGTTSTYDHLAQRGGRFSPYYFRLAPPNRRLAAHAAHWAKSGRLSADGRPATTAAVFYDGSSDDTYSTNLAEDFRDEFGRAKVTMLGYRDPSEIPAMVLQACRAPADVFYYAGRSDEFRSFVNQLSTTSCGDGQRIVLGGDEVTKYVSDNAEGIGRTRAIRLFYTPLAAREAWAGPWARNKPMHVFYTSFDPVVEKLVGEDAPADRRPSLAHSAMGYDAALTMIRVAQRVLGEQEGGPPNATGVLAAMTEQESGPLTQGATGLLGFGPRADGHQVPGKPVLLLTVRETGALQAVAVCGRLVEGALQDQGCPPGR